MARSLREQTSARFVIASRGVNDAKCALVGIAVVAASIVWLADTTRGAEDPCAEGMSGGVAGSSLTQVQAADTLVALIVFARFPDGHLPTPSCEDPDLWPDSLTAAPGFADSLFEVPGGPQYESSVTRYFDRMSGGKHVLYGRVFPDVITTPDSLVNYMFDSPPYPAANAAAFEVAIASVLDSVAASGYDFNDCDYDGDKVVDYVFINFRSKKAPCCDPIIPFAGFQGGGPETTWAFASPTDSLLIGGTDVTLLLNQTSERTFENTVEIAGHEYGHSLNQASDPPPYFNHLRSMGRYCIMHGTTTMPLGGPAPMSLWFRWKLGWVSPAAVIDLTGNSSAADTVITLRDSITHADSSFAIVKTAVPWQYFLLEARDSTGTVITNGSGTDACDPSGWTSGLAAYHICDYDSLYALGLYDQADRVDTEWRIGNGEVAAIDTLPPTVDPEITSGMINLTTWAPDPVAGFDLLGENDQNLGGDGDFFRPSSEGSGLFAPYTNPSTDLYAVPASGPFKDRRQNVRSGLTFDEIAWVDPPGTPSEGEGRISVRISYAGSSAPDDGPIELADGTVLEGIIVVTKDLKVPSGATVDIAPGTILILAARQDFSQSGTDPNLIEIDVEGTLRCLGAVGDSVIFTSSRDSVYAHFKPADLGEIAYGETTAPAAGDWFRIRVGPSGDLQVSATAARYAVGALNFSTSEFPDLSTAGSTDIVFQDNLLDITFDRDVTVPVSVTRIVPAGTKVGFGRVDQSEGGIDPSRIELTVLGDLDLQGNTAGAGAVTLQSATASGGAADWYGIVTGDSTNVSVSDVILKNARAGIGWLSPGWPDLSHWKPEVTFTGCRCELTLHRDYTIVSGTRTIPSGWTIGFAADLDLSQSGRDSTRIELIVNGALELESGVVLRSTEPDSVEGGWYGIRVSDVDDVIGLSDGASIQGAGGALSLEGAASSTWPTVSLLQDIQAALTFSGNISDLCYDQDWLIEAADSVYIPAGWRIGFTSDRDEGHANADTSLCEVVVEGVLVTAGTASQPVRFTSNTKAVSGNQDWYGIAFQNDGFGHPSTGFATTSSRIERTSVSKSRYGLRLEGVVAPFIIKPTFASIYDDQHIYVHETDVYVPDAGNTATTAWDLVGPMTVAVTDTAMSHQSGGIAFKVDIIANGKVVTSGSAGSRVVFRSTTRDSAFADDWGGLNFNWPAGQSTIRWVDIAFAVDPLFFKEPSASARVEDCYVHHYQNNGIWFADAVGAAKIARNTVERGAGLEPIYGRVGIVVNRSPKLLVQGNTVDLVGEDTPNLYGGAGIKVETAITIASSRGTPQTRCASSTTQSLGPTMTWLRL